MANLFRALRTGLNNRREALKAVRTHGLRYRHLLGATGKGIKHVVEQLERNEPLLTQHSSDLIRNGRKSEVTVQNEKGQKFSLTGLEAEQYRYKKILELEKLKQEEKGRLIVCKEKIRLLLEKIIQSLPDYNINTNLQTTLSIAIANAIIKNGNTVEENVNGLTIKIRYSKRQNEISFIIKQQGKVLDVIDRNLTAIDAKSFTNYGTTYTRLRKLIKEYKTNEFYDPEYSITKEL